MAMHLSETQGKLVETIQCCIVPTNFPWVSEDDGHVSKGLKINKFKNLIG